MQAAATADDARVAADEPQGWGTVGAAMVTLILGPSSLLVLCFGVFVQAWHTDFGWPLGRIALGSAVISFMVMVTSPLQGWLADRIGARRLLLTSLPVWIVSLAAMAALPPSLPVFYLACAWLPVAGLGLWPVTQLKIVSSWFERHLGLAIGITNTGLGIGAIFLPMTLQAIFSNAGWRTAYLALAAAVLLIATPAALWKMHERPSGASRTHADAEGREELRRAWRSPTFILISAAFWIFGAVSTSLLINLVSILVASGLSPAQAVATHSFLGIGSIAGRVVTGWLLDHVHARYVGSGIAIIGLVACLSLASPALAAAPVVPVVAALALGLLVGAEFDLLGFVIRRYYVPGAFGRLFGTIFAIFQLGNTMGIAGVALTHDWLGSFDPALAVLATLAGLGGILLFNLGPYVHGSGERRDAVRGLAERQAAS